MPDVRALKFVLSRSALSRATLAVVGFMCAGCVTAPAGQRRFYASRPYGTEQQFNPLSQIVSEGFDMLRTDDADRHLKNFPYAEAARNVRSSVVHVDQAVRQYGWSRWVRNELLPLSTKSGGEQWWPNYSFHLIGSGMVSARMTEWFEQHGISHPVVWSAVTMTASHLLNEMTERPGPLSVDAATDLLLFDPAGFLLFRSDRVQRWFSGERMQLTNWPLQASYALPGETLENVGQQYMLRFKLPSTTRWRGFYLFGVCTVLGVARDLGDARNLSFGLGVDAVDTPVVDAATDTRTVTLKPNAGIFFDRDGSLLASLLARNGYETTATLNVYPGAFAHRRLPVGFWESALRRGGVRFGVATPLGLGIAHSP